MLSPVPGDISQGKDQRDHFYFIAMGHYKLEVCQYPFMIFQTPIYCKQVCVGHVTVGHMTCVIHVGECVVYV